MDTHFEPMEMSREEVLRRVAAGESFQCGRGGGRVARRNHGLGGRNRGGDRGGRRRDDPHRRGRTGGDRQLDRRRGRKTVDGRLGDRLVGAEFDQVTEGGQIVHCGGNVA